MRVLRTKLHGGGSADGGHGVARHAGVVVLGALLQRRVLVWTRHAAATVTEVTHRTVDARLLLVTPLSSPRTVH